MIDLDRKSLPVGQCCLLLNVSRRTLYNWMQAGKVEWFRTAGGGRRVFTDTLWREGSTRGVMTLEVPPSMNA